MQLLLSLYLLKTVSIIYLYCKGRAVGLIPIDYDTEPQVASSWSGPHLVRQLCHLCMYELYNTVN